MRELRTSLRIVLQEAQAVVVKPFRNAVVEERNACAVHNLLYHRLSLRLVVRLVFRAVRLEPVLELLQHELANGGVQGQLLEARVTSPQGCCL